MCPDAFENTVQVPAVVGGQLCPLEKLVQKVETLLVR
jgi:hypothetical protein